MKLLTIKNGPWLIAALMLLQSVSGFAHPPGLSSLDLSINASQINVKAIFATQDVEAFSPMDTDLDAEVTDAEREASKPKVAKFLIEQLQIQIDGQVVSPDDIRPVSFDDQNNVHVELHYPAVPKQKLLEIGRAHV